MPWWSNGQDFMLSLLRAWVQSLVSELRFHGFSGQVYLGKTVSLITFLEMFSIYQNIKGFVNLCYKAIYIKQSKAVNSQINQAICCCLVTKMCPALCDSMDSSVHGISQARILEWIAVSFSRGSSVVCKHSSFSSRRHGHLVAWTYDYKSEHKCWFSFSQ